MEGKEYIFVEGVCITPKAKAALLYLQTESAYENKANKFNNNGIQGFLEDITELINFIISASCADDLDDKTALMYLYHLQFIGETLKDLSAPIIKTKE